MSLISAALGIAKLTGLDEKLGRWIGGDNGGAVAQRVVDVAMDVTGTGSIADAERYLKEERGALLGLEERLHAEEMELERLAYADRADARQLQTVALQQSDPVAKRFIYYFAAFWSLAAVAYIVCITFLPIPEASVRFADTILGFLLGTVIATIIGFFYGASATPAAPEPPEFIGSSG